MAKEKVSIDWQPDKKAEQPVYQQIIEYICQKISSGDWALGSFLPSQRELSDIWQVNRSTVSSALAELKSYGLIATAFGQGSKIVSNTWSLLLPIKTPNWHSYMHNSIFKANQPTIQIINQLEFQKEYLRLGTGEPDPALFPQASLAAVLKKMASSITQLNYLAPLGLEDLRRTLAERLKEQGIKASPNSILITSGSLQALQLISLSLLPPGEAIFTEAPSYLKSLQVFQSAGIKLKGIPQDDQGIKYWLLNKEKNGKLIYTIPNFHNPTGILMSEKRRQELLQFCQQKRLPIIEDDAYGELWFDSPPPPSLKSRDKYGTVLYLGTISKTLAPGLRLGWVIGPESVIRRLGDIKMQTDYGASSVSQHILNEFILSGLYDKHLAFIRRELKKKRDNALSALKKYFTGLADWSIPSGGFYIWLQLNKELPWDKLFELALKEKIILNPGSLYDFKANSFLRLSYSYCSLEEFNSAVKRLAAVINSYTP